VNRCTLMSPYGGMARDEPTIRQATDADLRRVSQEVLRGARGVPGFGSRALGWLLPRVVLSKIYAWLTHSGRGEIWLAQTPTAFATIVLLRRGAYLEAVDFVSTGEMLGLTLATELLERADAEGLVVLLSARGRARESYFRRLGFEPGATGKMIRQPKPPLTSAPDRPGSYDRDVLSKPLIPVFDGHNDVLTNEDHAGIVSGRPDGHIDLQKMAAGGMRGGIFAVYVPSNGGRGEPVSRDDGVLEYLMPTEVPHARAAAVALAASGRLFAMERAGHITVARTIADIDAAKRSGAEAAAPPVAVLHFEGAEAIDDELEALETWYVAGLRSLGPVWSRPNRFAHGVPFVYPSSPDTGPGITEAGQRLIRRCAELGILLDLAHLNEGGFWDVANAQLGPLVVSHAGAHTISQASRNLTDRQLDAVKDSNGLVGVVFASQFLRPDFADSPDTDLQDLVRHIEYIGLRIGIEHVALGSDFDGAVIPDAVKDASGLPNILRALSAGGFFSDSELELVAWDNWRRVLSNWWK
jgi:membrane dipeptidase